MSERQKSQKGFVAVTLITLLAIALVIVVYAALLGTFQGGNVTVVAVSGKVWYSTDNSTFDNATITNYPITDPWYTCFVTDTGGYTGTVHITWGLINASKPTTPLYTVTTSGFLLNGSKVQNIYASSNGLQATNYNWGQNTTVAGTYYIKVTFYTG